MKDVFEEGHVDKAIFQSTYLKYWYKRGFNTVEQNGAMIEKHPTSSSSTAAGTRGWADAVSSSWRRTPSAGTSRASSSTPPSGTRTARGWKLTDTESYRFLEKCRELGITNIHAHKGPTIWLLNKDVLDGRRRPGRHRLPDPNFIIEHAGIPRIDDSPYMAVQEPNVYAGCSVVIGALMHARPKFFAKVMGELLFWVGEDRLTFGSDYNIWTPKWQVEGLVDWQMPDDEAFTDYPRLTTPPRRRSSA